MRCKHISSVGAFLISVFVLLAAVAYYFNEGACPKGTFLCPDNSFCIKQSDYCNNKTDCLSGEDEAIQYCTDQSGSLTGLILRYHKEFISYKSSEKIICANLTENDPGYSDLCQYIGCKVSCKNIPENFSQIFSENITKLSVSDSTIEVFKRGFFNHYLQLRSLNFNNGSLKILEPQVFINQQELIKLDLQNNSIEEISVGRLFGLTKLVHLHLDLNKIRIFNLQDLQNSKELISVFLRGNRLTASTVFFPFLPNLIDVILDNNELEEIPDSLFINLPSLESLSLEQNKITKISPIAFQNQKKLIDLNLMNNQIKTLNPVIFSSFKELKNLKLGYNIGMELLEDVLVPLKKSLEVIGLEEIDIPDMELNFFNDFPKLIIAYFKRFYYCTAYAPKVRKCTPPMDGVSSLVYLLGTPMVRSAVWGISCLTCLSNALVLWGRFTARDENRVLSIIIRNLAVSDMLMGVYLFIIGLEDVRFENKYQDSANAWRTSWSCTFLGMLAMISSEVSVLILMFMSLERFMLISAPLKGNRAVTPRFATTSMFAVWLVGFTLALFPVINWRNNAARFYGQNGMCFPLHIEDPFHLGWEYTAFIILGINLIGLVTIGFAYSGMFISIWRTRHATTLSTTDSEFALRFFLIVLTDALCWTPIIVLKILALNKYIIGSDLHSWVVVFILPINSAVNPMLYTFTTPKFRERLREWWYGTMRKVASRKGSRDSQISNSCAHTTIINKDMPMTTAPNTPVIQDIFFKLYLPKDN